MVTGPSQPFETVGVITVPLTNTRRGKTALRNNCSGLITFSQCYLLRDRPQAMELLLSHLRVSSSADHEIFFIGQPPHPLLAFATSFARTTSVAHGVTHQLASSCVVC